MAADSSTVGVFIDKVTFLRQWPQLSKATSDDEVPIPGYLYEQVNALSLQSGSYCQALLHYLVDRLLNKSYHVKLKCLRLMRYIVENGHPEFRQGLRKRSQGVQDAMMFHGLPDPLHGNAPYLAVRKEAKELSEALFNVDAEDGSVRQKQSVFMKSTGGMGSSNTGKTLLGFGNTPQKPMSLGESLVSGLSKIAETVLVDGTPQPEASLQHVDKYFGTYQPAALEQSQLIPETRATSESGGVPANAVQTRQQQQGRGHRPGVAGGGWDDSEETALPSRQHRQTAMDAASGSGPNSQPVSVSSHESDAPTDIDRSDEATLGSDVTLLRSDGSTSEVRLVREVMSIQHQGLLLQRYEVTKFIKECSGLNCEKVVELLSDSLNSADPSVAMKVLLLLEGLLRTDYVTPECIAHWCGPGLLAVYQCAPGALGTKARKIVRLLQKSCKQQGLLSDLPPCQQPVTCSDKVTQTVGKSQSNETAASADSVPVSFAQMPLTSTAGRPTACVEQHCNNERPSTCHDVMPTSQSASERETADNQATHQSAYVSDRQSTAFNFLHVPPDTERS